MKTKRNLKPPILIRNPPSGPDYFYTGDWTWPNFGWLVVYAFCVGGIIFDIALILHWLGVPL